MHEKKTPLSCGEKLRLAREAKGLTLRDVEEISGVTISHLSNIERGLKDLTTGRFRTLALLYGVSTDWLLDMPARAKHKDGVAEISA